jgi:hypothetical protein
MATISKKVSPTEYERIGDTQGVMIPTPVRYTRFKPSNITFDGTPSDNNYYIKPTPAQCVAGGGEDWNNGTDRFYVPKAGIYTVSFPSIYRSSYAMPLIQHVHASNSEAKLSQAQNDGGGWRAEDISVYIPEGGYLRVGYNSEAGSTVQFDGSSTIGIFTIYLNEVNTPYMIANKGALVSSDETGKGKIDDDGTLSISGELGTGTDGSKVSISRPDKWNAGIEYDFGGGLFGVRRTGTVTDATAVRHPVGIVNIKPITFRFKDCGGSVVIHNTSPDYIYQLAIPSGGVLVSQDNSYGVVLDIPEGVRDNAPYDVWVTYTK